MDFNPTKQTVVDRTRTTNYEGGEAFSASTPENHLYMLVSANLLEDKYYQDASDSLWEIVEAVENVSRTNPEFVLQLAKFARQEMYLRDVSQFLLVLAAYQENMPNGLVAEYGPEVIQRADEPMTILGIWDFLRESPEFTAETSNTVPKPIKNAINAALEHFDAYQLSKWDTDRRERGLRDVLNLTHPKPKDDHQAELFQRIIYGDLDSGVAWRDHYEYGTPQEALDIEPLDAPETWEVIVSEHGNTQEAWEEALPRMGLFARLRNIRNMLDAGISETEILDAPIYGRDYETDELFTISGEGLTLDMVRDSSLFPFRFYSAYKAAERQLASAPRLASFLEDAINTATENIDDMFSQTAVAVDTSGSMRSPISRNSSVSQADIAALFGGALGNKGADVFAFANTIERVDAHPQTPTIEYTRKISELPVGGATYGWKFPALLAGENLTPDRAVILTDMQMYTRRQSFRNKSFRDHWNEYTTNVSPDTTLYVIDLSSYGDLVMPEDEVFQISGWDDNILNAIPYLERPGQMIERIKQY